MNWFYAAKTMIMGIAWTRWGVPQKPTYEHAGEASGREKDQNLRQQEEKKNQTQNHTSKAHSIMQVADDRLNLLPQLP
jgi:hypothetical protein